MPYLPTAESWLTQSSLLLQARPNTTRITTKYSLNAPIQPSKLRNLKKRAAKTSTTETTEPKATKPTYLVLKTYDAVSGTTLKYKTDKAADVGRLIASLGRLGRNMAALPEKIDAIMDDALEVQEDVVVQTQPVMDVKSVSAGTAKSGGAPVGGKKGKKKGKK